MGIAAAAAVAEAPAQQAVLTNSSFPAVDASNPAAIQALWDTYVSGFRTSQYNELVQRIDSSQIEGSLPIELRGTLLRNGPGLFNIGDKKVDHPFDGDGLIAQLTFEGDGSVVFRNRYVRTSGFVEEQRAGKPLFRSAFNRGIPAGKWFNNPLAAFELKNAANTNVVHWGDATYALYERGLPYRLEPDLTTAGEDDLNGTLDAPNRFFGAHFRRVTEPDGSQRLVGFNAGEKGADIAINLLEYDQGMRCLHKTPVSIKGAAFGFFHDVAVTERYYVLLQNPITMDFWQLLSSYTRGLTSLAECLKFDNKQKSRVILVPRPGKGVGSEVRIHDVEGPPFFCFHHTNAFETADRRHLVVDTCASNHTSFDVTERAPESMWGNPGANSKVTRVVLDLQSGKAVRHAVSCRNADLPAINNAFTAMPHTHSYFYASITDDDQRHGPPQAVYKVSMDPLLGVTCPWDTSAIKQQVWSPGAGSICQEPVFVPKPASTAEDQGWLLVLVLDPSEPASRLVVLDAQDITSGPVASIPLPQFLPFGLHGTWTDKVLGADGLQQGQHSILQGV